jgi:hypothetical protein
MKYSDLVLALAAIAGLAISTPARAEMPLNDTGMRACINFETGNFTQNCVDTGQDGEYGRDVAHPATKNGRVGFAFKKICHSGEAAGTGNCPADPQLGTESTDWGCTKDMVTGLIWEIKQEKISKTSTSYTFKGKLPNTVSYRKQVNDSQLCGASNWRLPTVIELMGILDFTTKKFTPPNEYTREYNRFPDPNWFPDVTQDEVTSYWTSDQSDEDYAWAVNGGYPLNTPIKNSTYRPTAKIRLVR